MLCDSLSPSALLWEPGQLRNTPEDGSTLWLMSPSLSTQTSSSHKEGCEAGRGSLPPPLTLSSVCPSLDLTSAPWSVSTATPSATLGEGRHLGRWEVWVLGVLLTEASHSPKVEIGVETEEPRETGSGVRSEGEKS